MKLFLSKNDPDSEVVTLPLVGEEEVENDVVNEEVATENNIDVSAVDLPENVVDEAFNNQEQEATIEESTVDGNTQIEITPEGAITEEIMPTIDENAVEEPTSEEVQASVETEDEVMPTVDETVTEEVEVPAEETVTEEAVRDEVQIPEDVREETVVDDNEIVETTEYIPEDTRVEEEPISEVPMDIGEEIDSEEQELKLDLPQDEDIDLDDDILERARVKVDSIDREENFDNFVEEKDFGGFGFTEGKEILDKVVDTLKANEEKINSLERQLAEQKEINEKKTRENESQREEIHNLEQEKTELKEANREMSKENEEKAQQISSLTEENNQLEDKGNYYKRAAITLASENDQLKAKVEDNEKVFQLLRGVGKIINSEDRDFEEEGIRQKVV